MHTLTLAIQVSLRCSHCTQDVYAGWVRSVRCHVCERVVSLESLWKKLDLSAVLAALEAPGKNLEFKDGPVLLQYRAMEPCCLRCGAAFSIEAISVASGSIPCSQCKAESSVRDLGSTTEWTPHDRWVLSDVPVVRRDPVWFACLSCGKGLLVDGTKRVISCGSCQQQNFIPGSLWGFFQPVVKSGPFFVIYKFSHRPLFELRAKQTKEDVRVLAARMEASDEELMLFAHEQAQPVLDELSRNPNTPPVILNRIAAMRPQLRLAVAKHPRTSLDTLELLVRDPAKAIRMAARNHQTYLDAGKTPPPEPEELDPPPPANKVVFRELLPGEDPFRSSPVADTVAEPNVSPTNLLLPPEFLPTKPKNNSWRNRLVHWVKGEKK